jgi:ATP-dependent protease HslVU (ClpYQ) peptidase subunit
VGPLENVEGYAVWTGQRDSGLTLIPEVKIAGDGQARINKSRWFVNYDRAGKPVAGPSTSVSEARKMASLLANFDWTKGVENFSDDEIRATVRLAKEYREELAFRDHMRQISQ